MKFCACRPLIFVSAAQLVVDVGFFAKWLDFLRNLCFAHGKLNFDKQQSVGSILLNEFPWLIPEHTIEDDDKFILLFKQHPDDEGDRQNCSTGFSFGRINSMRKRREKLEVYSLSMLDLLGNICKHRHGEPFPSDPKPPPRELITPNVLLPCLLPLACLERNQDLLLERLGAQFNHSTMLHMLSCDCVPHPFRARLLRLFRHLHVDREPVHAMPIINHVRIWNVVPNAEDSSAGATSSFTRTRIEDRIMREERMSTKAIEELGHSFEDGRAQDTYERPARPGREAV